MLPLESGMSPFTKKAENSNPDDSDCDGLVARLELSLKALADPRGKL